MKNPDILTATEPVAEAFEKLGILYYIGGSVASSAYGIARSTMDVDMVSDLKPKHVRSLVRMLESSYYIDENMILEAIGRCRGRFAVLQKCRFKRSMGTSNPSLPADRKKPRPLKSTWIDESRNGQSLRAS